MNVNRDVIDRIERLGVRYYITGSEALGRYAEMRTTRDMDIVLDLSPARYEDIIRPSFEDEYLVADLVVWPQKAIGSVIHRTALAKVDLILRGDDRGDDPWSRSAMDRRVRAEDPVVGAAWFISREDLLLAKLEWWMGGASDVQLRDCRSIIRLNPDLDWAYVERYAGLLGVREPLEQIRGG